MSPCTPDISQKFKSFVYLTVPVAVHKDMVVQGLKGMDDMTHILLAELVIFSGESMGALFGPRRPNACVTFITLRYRQSGYPRSDACELHCIALHCIASHISSWFPRVCLTVMSLQMIPVQHQLSCDRSVGSSVVNSARVGGKKCIKRECFS
jgi:hypothetical protein